MLFLPDAKFFLLIKYVYINDVCTPDAVWNCFGNQGLYDTNQLEWDFLSRFALSDRTESTV